MYVEKQLIGMIQHQIIARGIHTPQLLEALQRAPRHLFVPEEMMTEAYKDQALPLPEDRAEISRPFMVALMIEALRISPSDRVLEIGTGSGYQTGVLSLLCREVYTIERHYTLCLNAQRTLQNLSRHNIHFRAGDGSEGWKEKAPFDKIAVTGASRTIPKKFLEQIRDNGLIVIPLGDSKTQTLTRVHIKKGQYETENLIPCHFPPLISKAGEMTELEIDPFQVTLPTNN